MKDGRRGEEIREMDELMVRAGGSTTIGDAFLCDETRGVSKTLTFFQSRAKIVLSPAARASLVAPRDAKTARAYIHTTHMLPHRFEGAPATYLLDYVP